MTVRVRHPSAPLSGAERTQRITVLKAAAKQFDDTGVRVGFRRPAKILGIHPATLAVWAARHVPDAAKKIARGKGRQANSSEICKTRPPLLREMLDREPPLSITAAAAELGISHNALRNWLHLNRPDIYQEFLNGPRRATHALPVKEALHRAKTVRSMRAGGFRDNRIAERLGISGAALSFWLKRNAPHGLDELIDMLDDEDEVA